MEWVGFIGFIALIIFSLLVIILGLGYVLDLLIFLCLVSYIVILPFLLDYCSCL